MLILLAAGCWLLAGSWLLLLAAGLSGKLGACSSHVPHHLRIRTADSDGDVPSRRGCLRRQPATGDRITNRPDDFGGRAVYGARQTGGKPGCFLPAWGCAPRAR